MGRLPMGAIVLQDAHSSDSYLGNLAKKSWRQRFFGLFRKSRHDIAVLPRDSVLLPLVDGIALNRGASSSKPFSHSRSVSKRSDQVSMPMIHVGSVGIFFRVVNEDHSHDPKNVPSHNDDMADERDEYAVECGDRLRRTREALGFNKIRTFAGSFGLKESRYSKWETGDAMVPPWFVRVLLRHHDINFDWIYGGDDRRLPNETATNLRRQS